MKKTVRTSLFVLLVWLAGHSAHAAAPVWELDMAHSGIHFGIQHIFSTVKGYFDDFKADIRFDPRNLDQSSFDFTVAVKSINTNNTKRDNHLLSGDFFDAGKFETMRFKSTSIKHQGGDQYTVMGTLTVKDVSRDISVPFTFFGTKPNPFNPKQLVAGFEARMTIDRLAYGVGNGKFLEMGVVGKDAEVLITVEATRDN